MSGEIALQVISDDPDAGAASLLQWLRRDPDVTSHVELRSGPQVPGTLGEPLGTIVVELVGGSTFVAVLASLSHVVAAWIRSRRSDLRIGITRADGSEVMLEVKGRSLVTAEEIRVMLEPQLLPPPPDPPAAGGGAPTTA